MTITYHPEVTQGSDEWLAMRMGLLTASEIKLIMAMSGGGHIIEYRAAESHLADVKLNAKQQEVLSAIEGKQGSVTNLAFCANVSDSTIRTLIKKGAIEKVEIIEPLKFFAPPEEKLKSHVWEIAAQRISKYVEPRYIGDDMLRGVEDEFYARQIYHDNFAPVTQTGFVTNDAWGFTLGYSPDGLVGDDGLIEIKSRRQKFQIETIATGEVPPEHMMQLQTGLLVTGRKWVDFVSYSGGLPMIALRVEPIAEYQEAIIAAATAFEARVAERMQEYHATLATVRTVPTERRIEQEMFV